MRSIAAQALVLIFLCTPWLPCGKALAADYPDRPVHWVVPYPPGGTTDVIARNVAQAITQAVGWTIVIDNRAGAGGQVAMSAVAKGMPDGNTLLVSDASLATAPSLYKQLSFDPVKDLQAVALFATVPHIVVVNPSVPANSLGELVALTKQTRGKLNFGSGGVGSPLHLAGEALRMETGIAWTHIPYRGANPAMVAAIANEVQIATPSLPAALSLVQSGKLRALAVMSTTRLASLPNVPTVAELGYPNATAVGWIGLHAQSGTPQTVLRMIEIVASNVLRTPDLRERLAAQGADVASSAGDAYAKLVADEAARWNKVVHAAGIEPQ
jgi:tripartite-type tricarboxylate transporter receptor subunit TctC